MRKNMLSKMTFGVCILLAAMILVTSCAKKEPEAPADPTPAEPKVEAPKVETPVVEVPKVEAPKVEAPAAAAGMEALPIELPKPMFVGTPTNIQGVSNLEKPRGKARPPFYAPAGVKCLSTGMAVSGSDEEPIMGDLEMITDGDKEAADGSYVELGPFVQYVTIDLEEEYDIYAVLLWHFHKQARVYFDVVVQVSSDPDFIDPVTVYNNDLDNSAGMGVGTDNHYVETNEGRLIDAKGARGRYVRLYSSGNSANDLNHYIEVEVFGK